MASNPCTRCGKERIVSKTWTEEIESFYGGKSSITTFTESVCPNPECQKVVEEKLEVQRQKTQAIKNAKEERMKRTKISRKRKR